MSIIFDLERTNQLNSLPDKDLVDLCPPIEPYQVTKSHTSKWPFNVAGTAPRQFEGDVSNLHESVKNRWTDLNINPPYKPAIPEIQMMLEQELGALRKKEIVSVWHFAASKMSPSLYLRK